MSRETCIDECIASKAVEKCNCWPDVLPYRKHNNTGARQSLRWCARRLIAECYDKFVDDCEGQCPLDCKEESYAMTIKEQPFPRPEAMQKKFDTTPRAKWKMRILNNYNLHQPLTRIELVFATVEETYHVHHPALTLSGCLIEVAGLVGLFLGLSVLHIVDLYEFILAQIRARLNRAAKVGDLASD